jgi:hypothetical protein
MADFVANMSRPEGMEHPVRQAERRLEGDSLGRGRNDVFVAMFCRCNTGLTVK